MRLWILSDLHIEQSFCDLPNPRPEFDVIIAAGDIHLASEAVFAEATSGNARADRGTAILIEARR